MVLLSFMLIGWCLSMWISNTATTSMLIPIATAVANEFDPTTSSNRKRRKQQQQQQQLDMFPSASHVSKIRRNITIQTRFEIWSKNNVILAVNSGEKVPAKHSFHRKAPASLSVECGDFLRFIAVKKIFNRIRRISFSHAETRSD